MIFGDCASSSEIVFHARRSVGRRRILMKKSIADWMIDLAMILMTMWLAAFVVSVACSEETGTWFGYVVSIATVVLLAATVVIVAGKAYN